MNTPNGITERICERADAELKARVEKVIDSVWSLLSQSEPHKFVTTATTDGYPKVEVFYRESLQAIQKLLFAVNQKANQETAIAEFMQKVNSLDSQLAELRDSIPQ